LFYVCLVSESFTNLGSGDHALLMWEKKEPTDDTGTDVYSQLVLSQHVSGIIMPETS